MLYRVHFVSLRSVQNMMESVYSAVRTESLYKADTFRI